MLSGSIHCSQQIRALARTQHTPELSLRTTFPSFLEQVCNVPSELVCLASIRCETTGSLNEQYSILVQSQRSMGCDQDQKGGIWRRITKPSANSPPNDAIQAS